MRRSSKIPFVMKILPDLKTVYFVLLCIKITHMTTKVSAPNVEISIPHSIAVEVLLLP